ncbi:DUF6029 family protein [Bacteroidota bacterium]
MRKIAVYLLLNLLVFTKPAIAQLSGDLMLNSNFYVKDTAIGATTSQYLREFSSSEAWLFLNYTISGFNFSVRYDLFNNSALLDPNEVYTDQGIAFYSVNKKIGKLEVTAGHFYDQFGTGIIFRAFEDRILGLDYAVNGVKLNYYFSDNFRLKAFTGRQKNRLGLHDQVMKGIDIEKDFKLGNEVSWLMGAGLINRTLDKATMDILASEINSYKLEDRFIPKYNLFAATFYNTIYYKNFNLYVEYARKTAEAIRNKQGNMYVLDDGEVLFGSLNYSRKGFGVSVMHKRTSGFSLRTSPFTNFLVGTINYMPPVSKQQSKILPARYSISAQELGEIASQAEVTFSPGKKSTFSGNFTYVTDDENKMLFREYYIDYYRKYSKNFKGTIGLQSVYYDKLAYENENEPAVKTITPFSEFVYKISKEKSLRWELQYLFTEEDHGDFFFGLVELTIAPHYSFSIADMVNTKPLKVSKVQHYYNFFVAYTLNQTRFSLGYMKQVEGVVCTGGVCRVEPAFSGLKFNLTTSF